MTCLSENDLFKISQLNIKDRNWCEHKHECGGMSWAAVLPTEAILAARMLIKSINKESQWYLQDCSINMNLCHHYEKMQPDDKLELHIFAIVLACCLQSSSSGMLQLTGTSISEIVLLIAQVKVNAMAIVHMSSPDATSKSGISVKQSMTCSIKQEQVAQAIYLRGSAFNHSCDPNVHASFVSRSLLVHAIKPLTPGSPLELCYGPQVGESGLEERQRWLKKRYFFVCKCMGCSELNLSDLYFSSFRCAKDDCQGVVLDKEITKSEKVIGTDVVPHVSVCTRDLTLPADEQKQQSINAVASLLIAPENVSVRHINPGHCLRCGYPGDLERKKKVANWSLECIKRVYGQIHVHGDKQRLLDDALQFLRSLSSMLHAYNKEVAKILEKLYHSDHIVVANELVKLVSIEHMLNKYECAKKNLARIDNVFSRHYGHNYAKMFPYLRSMQEITRSILDEI
ncbi:uncharacterized protein LOC131079464 isoform X1 [Cryptomeria japonica]|uniref:uncharacterized protein LOC131079464 isoform X1 n=1 Tax=Cryptomeria japonica TaxID=3369 RepID=UPI0027D9DCE3|nr:uncharacterized protein LOC131079464 isoform X1 [Cryptomeria japonica]